MVMKVKMKVEQTFSPPKTKDTAGETSVINYWN